MVVVVVVVIVAVLVARAEDEPGVVKLASMTPFTGEVDRSQGEDARAELTFESIEEKAK